MPYFEKKVLISGLRTTFFYTFRKELYQEILVQPRNPWVEVKTSASQNTGARKFIELKFSPCAVFCLDCWKEMISCGY